VVPDRTVLQRRDVRAAVRADEALVCALHHEPASHAQEPRSLRCDLISRTLYQTVFSSKPAYRISR
jgi:hypothetical protein